MSNVLKSNKSSPSPVDVDNTNKKSVKSANIDEGYFKPDQTNKIDYLTVKEKSNMTKKEKTLTNDSMIN